MADNTQPQTPPTGTQASSPAQGSGPSAVADDQLRATIYFAVGVTSESRDKAYRLSIAGTDTHAEKLYPADNSGYTIGTLQTDLGQHYQPHVRGGENVPKDLVDAYQGWAKENHKDWALDHKQEAQTISDLGRNGDAIRADARRPIDATVQHHLDSYLASQDGITWVHNRDVAQVNKLMDNAVKPIQGSDVFKHATPDDQVRLVAITAKAYNQNETQGKILVRDVAANKYHSVTEVGASLNHLDGYFRDGRDGALSGAKVVNSLRNADATNPLSPTWQNVASNTLVNPTELDKAPGNLAAEYPTVKGLFVHDDKAVPFITALDKSGAYQSTPLDGHHPGEFKGAGFVAEGKEFVSWGADGQGHAFTNNTWSAVNRSDLSLVQNADHSKDLSITNDGATHPMLRVAQPAPPHQDHPAPHHGHAAHGAHAPAAHEAAPAHHAPAHHPAPHHAPPSHAHDPRDAGHPEHAMNQSVHGQIGKLYAENGLSLDAKQHEALTAGVMADARREGMKNVSGIAFGEDFRSGKIDTTEIHAFQGSPEDPRTKWSATQTQQAAQTAPEQHYQQFAQATQQQVQAQQQVTQQNALVAQPQPQGGPTMRMG